MVTIDISGPDGNAFALLGYAKRFGKQLSFSSEKVNQIIENMTSGDYSNLLKVFQEEFGDYVELVGVDLEDE
jgi:hypothetical protein